MATQKKTKTKASAAKSKKSAKAGAKSGKDAKKAAKAPRAPRAEKPAAHARHPLARVKEKFGSKADLVKTLVEPLAAADEDTDQVRDRLLKASNHQLLRLHRVVASVNEKFGGRDKMIASITKAMNKAKDTDYLAKLASLPLPRLLDLATTTARRAKQA